MEIPPNSIRIVNDHEGSTFRYYPVLIIGAGASGIAMGCRLKEVLGFDQFRIFERQAGIGGTWWINRYPGVACDIPAVFYSFSFSPNHAWTSFHPSGPEILRYLQDVCSKYQILNNIQCNTDISDIVWLPDEEVWEAKILHMVEGKGDMSRRERERLMEDKGRNAVYIGEETVRAKVVCSCAGGFVEPNAWPHHIPGPGDFKGDICHTARWNPNINFHDKDVIVVGSGCSAAQVVPQLLKVPYKAKSVTQVMRSPPWVVPRPIPPIVSEKQWEQWSGWLFTRFPIMARLVRFAIFLTQEKLFFDVFSQSPRAFRKRSERENWLLQHLKQTAPEEYWDILRPNYSVGCKRQIYDAYWFPSLNDPRIKLTTRRLVSVQALGVTLGPVHDAQSKARNVDHVRSGSDSVEVPANVIVLANGFEVQTWLAPTRIVGRSGQELQQVWNDRGGAQAYLGVAHDGFPNFFTIFGPNTATGHSSVIMASENMINYSLKFIRQLLSGEVRTFEVKQAAQAAWTVEVQQRLNKTVFNSGGCMNWYQSQTTGWNATVYPYSQVDFWIRCTFPKWNDWNIQYTRKGRIWVHLRRLLRVSAFIILIAGFCFQKRVPTGTLPYWLGFLRQSIMRSSWRNQIGIENRVDH